MLEKINIFYMSLRVNRNICVLVSEIPLFFYPKWVFFFSKKEHIQCIFPHSFSCMAVLIQKTSLAAPGECRIYFHLRLTSRLQSMSGLGLAFACVVACVEALIAEVARLKDRLAMISSLGFRQWRTAEHRWVSVGFTVVIYFKDTINCRYGENHVWMHFINTSSETFKTVFC